MKPDFVNQYDRLERGHWWHLARRQIVIDILGQHAPAREERQVSVADIGCGAGTTLGQLSKTYTCFGIEPNINLATKASNCSGVPIFSESLPLHSPGQFGKVDIVLLLDVIEHIEDDLAALKSIRPMLQPDSVVIINVPAMPQLWSVHDDMNEHKRRYTRPELRQLIENAGLEIDLIRFWNTVLAPLAWIQWRVLGLRSVKSNYHLGIPPLWLNRLVMHLVVSEYNLTKRIPLAFGMSLLAVAKLRTQ